MTTVRGTSGGENYRAIEERTVAAMPTLLKSVPIHPSFHEYFEKNKDSDSDHAEGLPGYMSKTRRNNSQVVPSLIHVP